jgi:hypothetical protein
MEPPVHIIHYSPVIANSNYMVTLSN